MNESTPNCDAQVIVNTALEAAKPSLSAFDNGLVKLPFLAHSERVAVQHLESALPYPARHKGRTELLDITTLTAWLKHQSPASSAFNPVIYADRGNLNFTAILNHPTPTSPGWGDYQARVQLRESRQLQKWKSKNGSKMSQEAFALFLEEMMDDIVDPVASEVLHFAETLEARRTEVFKSTIRTTTGECNLVFASERDGEHSTKLIETFTLGIPLFEGDERYSVRVKLFHRVIDQKLTFWYQLLHLEYIMDKSWEEQVEKLTGQCDTFALVFEGTAPDFSKPTTPAFLS